MQALHHAVRSQAVLRRCMVARGDLGVEMALEEVPMVQRDIIAECRRQAQPPSPPVLTGQVSSLPSY